MTFALRPTVPEDIQELIGRPFPYRVRAYTGLVDGVVKGIGGAGFLPDGTVVAFMHLAEDATRYKVTLHKAALRVLAELKNKGLKRMVAQVSASYPNAEQWLLRLGFVPVTVDGERVMIWQSS